MTHYDTLLSNPPDPADLEPEMGHASAWDALSYPAPQNRDNGRLVCYAGSGGLRVWELLPLVWAGLGDVEDAGEERRAA